MKINNMTMLITDFEDIDIGKLNVHIREFILNGNITEYVQSVFNEWAEKCELNSTNRLKYKSSIFPLRVLLSIDDHEYNLKYKYYRENGEWPPTPWRS